MVKEWTESDSSKNVNAETRTLTFTTRQFTIRCAVIWDADFLQHPPDAGNVMKKFQDQVFKRLKGINDVSVMQGNYFAFYQSKPSLSNQRDSLYSKYIRQIVNTFEESIPGTKFDMAKFVPMLKTLKKQFEKTVCLFHWIGFLKAILQLASRTAINLLDAQTFAEELPNEFFVDSVNPFVTNPLSPDISSAANDNEFSSALPGSEWWRNMFLVSEDASNSNIYHTPNRNMQPQIFVTIRDIKNDCL